MTNPNKSTNGRNGRDITKQAELVKKAMKSDLTQSGINEAQAAAIAEAIAGSEVRVREHFDERFDILSAKVDKNEAANAARHEKSEAANAARHEKIEAKYDDLIKQMFEIHTAMRRQIFWLIGAASGIAGMVYILSKFL